jgi:hypothetical protein
MLLPAEGFAHQATDAIARDRIAHAARGDGKAEAGMAKVVRRDHRLEQ